MGGCLKITTFRGTSMAKEAGYNEINTLSGEKGGKQLPNEKALVQTPTHETLMKKTNTAPSTYGRPLHQHPFDIGDVLEMWTWTMSIELYGPMLNGTMNSSVHMNKPTEQRYVGVFVHPRVSDGQYHCKRQAPYDKIECLLIYPSASVVPCGVSGYQPL